MSIRLPSPDTCHPDRTWLLRRYLHLLSERPKDWRPCNCGLEILGGSGSCKLRHRVGFNSWTIGGRKCSRHADMVSPLMDENLRRFRDWQSQHDVQFHLLV